MMDSLKHAAKSAIRSAARLTGRTKLGAYFHDQVIRTNMEHVVTVKHGETQLQFAAPNSLCRWRAETFSSKEPETLEWIDTLPTGSILWDVGANIGLYSVYAAKTRGCRVWAFEPSVFNLELLARNVALNGLATDVCIVPVALSDKLASSQMRLTTTDWGGALSTFGEKFGWDGKEIRQVFEFKTIGLTMEDAIRRLDIPQPDYIKMDVDGVEHLILAGGGSVLGKVKQVLIEVNDNFKEQAEQCALRLAEAGLTLKEKRHSTIIANSSSGFDASYNQIWVRA
jgi:FkbM family methyltransferase